MTQEELDKIIEQHKHWWNEDFAGWEGMKANLCERIPLLQDEKGSRGIQRIGG